MCSSLGGVMVFVSLPGFSTVGRTRLVVVAVQGAPIRDVLTQLETMLSGSSRDNRSLEKSCQPVIFGLQKIIVSLGSDEKEEIPHLPWK